MGYLTAAEYGEWLVILIICQTDFHDWMQKNKQQVCGYYGDFQEMMSAHSFNHENKFSSKEAATLFTSYILYWIK